jgi:hypothetical protein
MKIMNGLDLQSQKITSLADPSSASDAATKQYVDNVAAGMQWKAPVRAATTANGTLATAYANTQVIDGVTLATGNRILIKNQSAASENGLYIVAASGAPTRATDADAGNELAPGTAVTIAEGTINADKAFMIISDAAITIGTTSQTWGQFSAGTSYSAGNGISIAASVISAVAASGGGLSVVAGGIQLDTSLAVRKFNSNVGNGSSTSIAVTHNLGTQDIVVAVRDTATNAGVLVDWVATDTNTVTLSFAVAPASNTYRCSVYA